MKSYINDMIVTDPNGEKAILYPNTKQEAVEGLLERLANVEKPDITEITETTMPNSFDGRFLFKKIKGAVEQGENPSPENPQEIKSSVVSEIKTHGNDKETTVTFISPIELRRIEVTANDDYTYEKDGKYYIADTIEKIDGVYKKVERIVESNGQDLSWSLSATYIGSVNTRDLVGVIKYDVPVLCTHTEWIKYSLTNYVYGKAIVSGAGQVNFYLKNEAFADANEVKTWMLENDFYFQYVLLEPIITSLPTADQIALNSLETFDGITYLEFDSEIKPEFEGEYGTSKAGGYMLESLLTARNNDIRISNVEATVVNNI